MMKNQICILLFHNKNWNAAAVNTALSASGCELSEVFELKQDGFN